jgi:hypothetical protein
MQAVALSGAEIGNPAVLKDGEDATGRGQETDGEPGEQRWLRVAALHGVFLPRNCLRFEIA